MVLFGLILLGENLTQKSFQSCVYYFRDGDWPYCLYGTLSEMLPCQPYTRVIVAMHDFVISGPGLVIS